jgi:hypothetical protein
MIEATQPRSGSPRRSERSARRAAADLSGARLSLAEKILILVPSQFDAGKMRGYLIRNFHVRNFHGPAANPFPLLGRSRPVQSRLLEPLLHRMILATRAARLAKKIQSSERIRTLEASRTNLGRQVDGRPCPPCYFLSLPQESEIMSTLPTLKIFSELEPPPALAEDIEPGELSPQVP